MECIEYVKYAYLACKHSKFKRLKKGDDSYYLHYTCADMPCLR